jgi:hypothetical protein
VRAPESTKRRDPSCHDTRVLRPPRCPPTRYHRARVDGPDKKAEAACDAAAKAPLRRGVDRSVGKSETARHCEQRVCLSIGSRSGARRRHSSCFAMETDRAKPNSALFKHCNAASVRVARRLNRLLFRRGSVVADRWHSRNLSSPRAVRNALVYVLANFRKHGERTNTLIDECSSAPYFREFAECNGRPPPQSALPSCTNANRPAPCCLRTRGC